MIAEFVGRSSSAISLKPKPNARLLLNWMTQVIRPAFRMLAAITGNEPDVAPEIAASHERNRGPFLSDRRLRELG